MTPMAAADLVRLQVPASPEHVATMRSFAGAVARHFGCAEETIDDLRVAVTEAAAQALDETQSPDRFGFDLTAWLEERTLMVQLEPAARFLSPREPAELDPASGERRWALISALFPGAQISREDTGGTRLRLPAPCAGDG